MISHPWRAWVFVLLDVRCCVAQPEVTPVYRVVQLLTDIQTQLQRIGANDETLYSHYQEYCQAISHDTELNSIQLSARMSSLGDEIGEQKRFQQKENREITLATKRLNERKADLARSNAEREQEHREYLTAQQFQTQSSLGPTVDALDRAIEKAQLPQENRGFAVKALARALSSSYLRDTLTSSEQQFIDGIARDESKPAATSFLQVSSSRTAGQSLGSKTLSSLKEMLQTHRISEASATSEERNEEDEYKRWGTTVLVELGEESNEINTRKSEEEESEERAGEDQSELDVAQQEAPLSEEELHSVESECQRRSREYTERKRLRTQEEQVIANAKALLLSVSGMNGMNVMPAMSAMPGFLQVRSTMRTEVQQHARSPMSSSRVGMANSEAPMPALLALRSFLTAPRRSPVDDQRVSANLRQRMSAVLLQARSKGRTQADPLAGVRKIVQEMIERLLTEAAEEAEHQAWCDAEEEKVVSMKKEKEAEVHRLQNQIRTLSALKQNLIAAIDQLKSDMQDLEQLAAEAIFERDTEHKAALMSIQGYQSAQAPLQQAIQVLQNFYQPDASSSFLQEGYESQATAGSQAISMLQELVDKFTESARNADAAEKQAARSYDAISREGQERVELLQRDLQLRTSGDEHIANSLNRAQEDLDGYQKELVKLAEYTEKIKASCEEAAEGPADRRARRKAEIEHLQEALKILNDQTSPLDSSSASGDAAFSTIQRLR